MLKFLDYRLDAINIQKWSDVYTTTEQAFVSGLLSRLPLGSGQYVAFVPSPTASRARRGQGPFVSVGGTNRDKRGSFILVGGSNRDKRPAQPFGLLFRLEPPTEIKGPPFVPVGASNRDKTPWPPYPLSSPLDRVIQLTCSCCSWLGRGEFFLISSPHLWRSLIPPSIHRC